MKKNLGIVIRQVNTISFQQEEGKVMSDFDSTSQEIGRATSLTVATRKLNM